MGTQGNLSANQVGERFDEDNLTEAFQWACQNYQESEEILNYLFDRVHQFIGMGNQNGDDMTLVVMRVTPATEENHHDS